MLSRLLSILALIGFITIPMMTPPAWAVNAGAAASHTAKMDDMTSMAGMASMKGSMECCPQQKPVVPSCPKHCPWAALCVAKCFSNTVSAAEYIVFASLMTDRITPENDQNRDRMGEPPPPRPPRT